MAVASSPAARQDYRPLLLRAEAELINRGRLLEEAVRLHPTDPVEQAALELWRAARRVRAPSRRPEPYIIERRRETNTVTVRRGAQKWRVANVVGVRSPEEIILCDVLRDSPDRSPTNEEVERLARAFARCVNLDAWLVTVSEARSALRTERTQ